MHESIEKFYRLLCKQTMSAMRKRGFQVYLVRNSNDALKKIQKIIPKEASVMTGGSTTLQEIGCIDLLQGSKYNYLKKVILQENDPKKRRDLRRLSLTADYFIASANAISKSGEIVLIDHGGSRVSAYSYAAKNIIIVSGVNKIVPTLSEALSRAREFAGPIEAIRTGEEFPYGSIGKTLIIEKESVGRINVILVLENLGF